MPAQAATATNGRQEAARLYQELEDRMLARDQEGGSRVYYELLRRGRPLPEIMAEAVRIHAPYTHVPYHQRIDDGFPNFVNNDHCLLSARAAVNLQRMLPEKLAGLPLAQTIWYIPSGLDIWNQKILKAPGHYATRGYKMPNAEPPKPVVYWPDQEPLRETGPLGERLNNWLTLVERGQVIDAYRVFLGLMEETEHRKEVLAQLVFAGMIDVQDRMLYNRSYTTGHKAYRARSVVEIGNAIGWDNAHDVIYAGALDIAVGPRWHSVYEMACNVVTIFIEGKEVHAVPQGGTSERERALLANTGPLNEAETEELIDALIHQHEPAYIEKISALLLAGKSPRRIIDAIQLAAAQVVLETVGPEQFLDAPAHLRVLQHDRLVLRQFRAPAAAEIALCGGLHGQPGGVEPAQLRLAQIRADQGSERRRPNEWQSDHRAFGGGDRRPRPATGRSLDQGLSRQRRRSLAARPAARLDGDADRERPAQPGNPAMHAGGLRQEPEP